MVFARWFARNRARPDSGTDAFGNPLTVGESPTAVGGLSGADTSGLGGAVTSGLGEAVTSGLGEAVTSGLGASVADDVGAEVPSQSEHVVLRQFFHDEFSVAAVALGLSRGELARRLHEGQGRSIAEVAADVGVARQTIVDAVVRDTMMRLDAQAANGTISSSEAGEAKSRVPAWATGFADRRRPAPAVNPGAG